MRRRDKAGGKAAKIQRRKKLAHRNMPKAASRSLARAKETNVAQLIRERDEALEQQAATSEILGVIRRSPTNAQPVFDAIVESASRLCEAVFSAVWRYDGGLLHYAASHNFTPELLDYVFKTFPKRPDRSVAAGRAILDGRIAHVPDLHADRAYSQEAALAGNWRASLAVPMLRDGKPLGVISVGKAEAVPFSRRQIQLLTTFADQAVIAIENVRLFNETKEALEQQTATSEVLKVISASPGQLEPVFNDILENAVRICAAKFGILYRCEEDALRTVSMHGAPQPFVEERLRNPIVRPSPDTTLGRALATKQPIQIADILKELNYFDARAAQLPELAGARTVLAVPMVGESELMGAILIYRQEVRPFTDKQIELVKNFAAQGVIAIENARLLKELRERTLQLEAQSQEVVKLNQQLERRVADQVGEIERMSRLRRFLPPQVADLIVASGMEKRLESHRREITALFCDLRGFTGFSEKSDPEDVMLLLREYHAAIGEIIIKYSGTLEHYAGDGVMIFFNDPIPVPNPALQAVRTALDMRTAIESLTEKWRRLGHELGFGVGIAHGFATLGTIGFEGRFDYAAIGTVSNVASRLCDEAKPGQILISPKVLMAVEDAVTVEPVGDFALKGISRPVAAYNVLSAISSKI
jgi:adenylate cyclase